MGNMRTPHPLHEVPRTGPSKMVLPVCGTLKSPWGLFALLSAKMTTMEESTARILTNQLSSFRGQ